MPQITYQHIDNITFNAAPQNYTLNNEVHIWHISIEASARLVVFAGELLSPDEKARAARYHLERDRNRFIVSRMTLRLLLEQYLDQPADAIQFRMGDNKKPFVQSDIPFYYNVAHAGDKILIAVSDNIVGIDVEHIDRELDTTDIATTCFSTKEQEFVAASADSVTAFYRLWTRKEALLKATGKGIDDDIVHVPALDGVHNSAKAYTGATEDMQVAGFAIGENYLGCVATPVNVGISLFNR
jgi:4'-phosphopantetheinyl transferase